MSSLRFKSRTGFKSQFLASMFNTIRKEHVTDCVLIVEQKKIEAHKLVLSSVSSFFKDHLKSVEPYGGVASIIVAGMSFRQVHRLVALIYEDRVDFEDNRDIDAFIATANALGVGISREDLTLAEDGIGADLGSNGAPRVEYIRGQDVFSGRQSQGKASFGWNQLQFSPCGPSFSGRADNNRFNSNAASDEREKTRRPRAEGSTSSGDSLALDTSFENSFCWTSRMLMPPPPPGIPPLVQCNVAMAHMYQEQEEPEEASDDLLPTSQVASSASQSDQRSVGEQTKKKKGIKCHFKGCRNYFASERKLKLHLLLIHMQTTLKCPFCRKKYKIGALFDKHLLDKHPQEMLLKKQALQVPREDERREDEEETPLQIELNPGAFLFDYDSNHMSYV